MADITENTKINLFKAIAAVGAAFSIAVYLMTALYAIETKADTTVARQSLTETRVDQIGLFMLAEAKEGQEARIEFLQRLTRMEEQSSYQTKILEQLLKDRKW